MLAGEQLEGTLLGLVTGLDQVLQSLLAALGGLAAHNTTVLVVLEVLAGEATGSVVGGAVHHLGTGANGAHLAAHLGDGGTGGVFGMHLSRGHILTTTHTTSVAAGTMSATSLGHFLPRS